ncbi:hypothetical protein [Microbacterium sp. ZW T5_56]|uniref:hypothetical protein n=1 Tax=Microbacterium sp. ZW T5_56 TaxID=3378081 RepID=UPI0038519341
MDLGLDIATVGVAAIAGAWTFTTWRAQRRADEEAGSRKDERQRQRDKQDARRYLQRDIAEAHSVHKEVTSRQVLDALQNVDVGTNRQFLEETHRRLLTRAALLQKKTEREGQSTDDGSELEPFLTMISDRLEVIRTSVRGPEVPSSAETLARDFTKYSWEGGREKHGKGSILYFIGARFARLNHITTADQFRTQFGAVVEQILADDVKTRAFVKDNVLVELFPASQSDRAATSSRRWREDYGSQGVMTLEGVEYRTAWDLGFPGGGIAPLQKKLIRHFAGEDGYPIEELPSA